MKNQQKAFVIPIIIAIIAVLGLGGGIYIYNTNQKIGPDIPPSDFDEDDYEQAPPVANGEASDGNGANDNTNKPPITITPVEPVACTMDAMQCPDGSWVGRSGPNCEFVCP